MDTEILLNEFDDFNNEENIIEPFTDNYYKLKKWLTTIGGQFDAPVSGKFAEEDIKKRYDMICKQIELWQKRIKKEWSYEDGYKNGLTYAEKQFRNLFE